MAATAVSSAVPVPVTVPDPDPVELATISCSNTTTTTTTAFTKSSPNSNSKVYNKSCKSYDHLKDTSGTKAKKNNTIREVKKMMATPIPTDLTTKQASLIESIKINLPNTGKLNSVEEKQKIAAVLFDMKALGDITQFEYFIANLDLFETFETHDTILLLLAIICIGDKHTKLATKYNTLTSKKYLYFATAFTKSGETVPYYYRFAIDDLKTIYDKICESVRLAPSFPSYVDDDTMLLLLKVFARILDSCHDFLNDKTKEEEDEVEGELLIIEHYLNSIFNPAD